MKFRVIKKTKNEKERYELFYFDEYDNKGQRWKQVIWNRESYLNFTDENYETSLDAIDQRAREFAQKYKKEHGELIKEFEITNQPDIRQESAEEDFRSGKSDTPKRWYDCFENDD